MCLTLQKLEVPRSRKTWQKCGGRGGHLFGDSRKEKWYKELWEGRPGEGNDWTVKT